MTQSRTGTASELSLHALRQVCSSCSLRELCVPMGLPREDMDRLDELVERRGPFRGGEHLFRVGEPFSQLYAVRSGVFKSYALDEDGKEQVLGFHLPGELMGLDAIHPGTHRCAAMALDTAQVCALPFDELSELAQEVPALQATLFRLLSKEISDKSELAADHTAEQRIASFLLALSRRYKLRGYSAAEFVLTMHRRDIANYLRLATETVSRVFKRFQDSGWIAVDRRHVRLLDTDALKALIGDE